MSEARTRLTDAQVDGLADAMESFVAEAAATSFHNYELAHDPMRKLGVQRATGFPRPDLTTSATFGLAHEDWRSAGFPDRIELVHAWAGGGVDQERFLVAVAETVLRRARLPKPGVVYRDAAEAARLFELKQRLPHALVLFPYLFGDRFEKVSLSGANVWFLQVVPIYENEAAFIAKNGFQTFEELLASDGVSFHDLSRPSHITR